MQGKQTKGAWEYQGKVRKLTGFAAGPVGSVSGLTFVRLLPDFGSKSLPDSIGAAPRPYNRPVNPSRDGHCQLCCGRGALGGTNKFANFFMVEIPVVFRRKFFLNKELYLKNHPPRARRETKEERAARFLRLMDENGWTRAELARQLGISRAWVTKVLKDLC